jgi:hypothetical protein
MAALKRILPIVIGAPIEQPPALLTNDLSYFQINLILYDADKITRLLFCILIQMAIYTFYFDRMYIVVFLLCGLYISLCFQFCTAYFYYLFTKIYYKYDINQLLYISV